jgi:hypothetical protein
MFVYSPYRKEVVAKHRIRDIKLAIIDDLAKGTLGDPDLVVKVGDSIVFALVPTAQILKTCEAGINNVRENGEKLNTPIKNVTLLIYSLGANNVFDLSVVKEITLETWKTLQNLDQTKLVLGVTKITFGDDSVSWSLLGPTEPRNVIKQEEYILEKELGYNFFGDDYQTIRFEK